MSRSAAQSPSVDVNDLNFDTCERLRHLDWLLTQLGISERALILDVGGYPCYMARAFPSRKIVTADMYAKGHAPYVKASGAALPFPDGTFEVTVACDVLEHVPPQYRPAFLSELARVSSRAVVVAGPYTTPGTARAELTIRKFLPESSPAQMWLAEHAECGLPSLRETLQAFSGPESDVRVLPVGTLTEWILFFAAQAAGERDHNVATSVSSFIAQYNRLHIAQDVSFKAPAYRHAVVAALNLETRDRLSRIVSDQQNAKAISDQDDTQIEEYVDCLGNLLQKAFFQQKEAAAGGGVNRDVEADGLTAEYIARLETMLSHRGMAIPQRNEVPPDAPPGQRLRRAWSILRGRE